MPAPVVAAGAAALWPYFWPAIAAIGAAGSAAYGYDVLGLPGSASAREEKRERRKRQETLLANAMLMADLRDQRRESGSFALAQQFMQAELTRQAIDARRGTPVEGTPMPLSRQLSAMAMPMQAAIPYLTEQFRGGTSPFADAGFIE